MTAVLLSAGVLCHADAWLDAGDSVLRGDLQYLVDSGVIHLPVSTWPIPSNDLVREIAGVENREALSAGQFAALLRLERRLEVFKRDSVRMSAHASAAVEPTRLRSFENTPREEGEIGASLSAANARISARIALSAVSNPDDDQSVRLDGSYGTLHLGNWLLTAGSLDRWWGPGWDGSLILSSNARPVPALSLDRESSEAFRSKWLRWIGPWRFSTFMGQMESERADVSRPLLFGMRLSFRPLEVFEVGLIRTAQWCGRGRPCDGSTFWNLVTGNDNVGGSLDPEDEPGNQLAGYDLRFTSPWKRIPLTVYRQIIGEDMNARNLPSGKLIQWGAESWHGFEDGKLLRLQFEYDETSCSDLFDCAYNHHIFSVEGYRYRGRPLGYSADSDAKLYSVGLQLTGTSGWNSSLLWRFGDLNRDGAIPDTRNTIASEPTDIQSLEAGLRLPFERGELRLGLGLDRLTTVSSGDRKTDGRGFFEWRQNF